MAIHKISNKITIGKSTIFEGKGIFAKDNIKKGDVLITIEENLSKKTLETPYLNHIIYSLVKVFGTFFKHCCNQNITIFIDNNRIQFKGAKDIRAGEELFINYNTVEWGLGEGFTCNCGSENCLKKVRGMKHLTEADQKRISKFSTPYIKKELALKKDRIDELGVKKYSKVYEEKVVAWEKSARVLFNEALDFIFKYKLPKKGKCVEIGVYKGESYLKLLKKYGVENCLGIDIANYANLPNIIKKDIRKFKKPMQIKLGINDLPWDCPQSKLAAHKWFCKNVLKGGLIVLTGYRTLDLSKYENKKISKIYENFHVRLYKKVK